MPASLDDLEATTGPLPESVRELDDPVAAVARAVDEAMGDHETLSKSDLSSATTTLVDYDLAQAAWVATPSDVEQVAMWGWLAPVHRPRISCRRLISPTENDRERPDGKASPRPGRVASWQ